MPNKSLWPPVGGSPPRTMAEMLYDAAGDLGAMTNGKLDFYVDAVGVALAGGPVSRIRYNCYIRMIAKSYLHLFFQVTTPPAARSTPSWELPRGISTHPSRAKRSFAT